MKYGVACFYVLGMILTIGPAVHAWYKGKREVRELRKIVERLQACPELDLNADITDNLSDEPYGQDGASKRFAVRKECLDKVMVDVDPKYRGAPNFNELELNLEFWGPLAVADDIVSAFRVQGLLIGVGVVVSAVANILSLWL